MNPRETVLIVDDERINLNVLLELLAPLYETMVAKSGEVALQLLDGDRLPDIVLLDVVMPGMDGYEVCRRIKENPRTTDIPVIFITSLDGNLDEQHGLELGAADYIVKPFSPPLVRLRVRNHLKMKRQSDMLRDLATVDGLTSIPNRRCFNQALEIEWAHSMRHRTPLSLILMDIDFFKSYNDNYGHLAGDECLIRVAQALPGVIGRASDLVARYGGEEFVCLLPNVDHAGALRLAENFRQAVESAGIRHEHSRAAPVVTLSLGVATMVAREDCTAEDIIKAADVNLYQAKEQGRNRAVGSGQ